jgi:hypothetical protein
MAKPRHTQIGPDTLLTRVACTQGAIDRRDTQSLRDVLAERCLLATRDAGTGLLAVRDERSDGGHSSHRAAQSVPAGTS